MLNKFMCIGNLGQDPETQVTNSGASITKFGVAVTRKYVSNGEPHEETEWFNIIAWSKLGEICAQYLHKGSKVFIAGRLTQRKYTDKNGTERTTVEVIASDMEMLSPKESKHSDPFAPEYEEAYS